MYLFTYFFYSLHGPSPRIVPQYVPEGVPEKFA
jgi:hypothetical protein